MANQVKIKASTAKLGQKIEPIETLLVNLGFKVTPNFIKTLQLAQKMNGKAEFDSIVFKTVDPELTKPAEGNRGGENETHTKDSKVNHLKTIIKAGDFIEDYPIAIANGNLTLINGHNTKQALVESEQPYRFVVSFDKRLNSTDINEINDTIAFLNNETTKWTKDDVFNSAFFHKNPVAVEIKKLIDKYPNDRLFPLHILGVVHKKASFFSGIKAAAKINKFVRSMYRDRAVLRKLRSPEFKKSFNYYLNLTRTFATQDRLQPWLNIVYTLIWEYNADRNIMGSSLKTGAVQSRLPLLKKKDERRLFIVQTYNKSAPASKRIEMTDFLPKKRGRKATKKTAKKGSK